MSIEYKSDDEFKYKHLGSLIDLWKIYKLHHRLICSFQFWSAILFSIIIIIVCLLNHADAFYILQKIIDKVFTILPNILGFNLGGYVLVIGLGYERLLKELTDNDDEGYSFFQHNSSIFAWSIFIQALALITAYIFSIISDLSITSECASLINYIALGIILLLSSYAIFLIIRIVLNVFLFGQTIHFLVTLHKKEDENNIEVIKPKLIKRNRKNIRNKKSNTTGS